MHVLPPESLAAPRNSWDMAVEGILGALLLFMPLAFGAVEAWSELVVIAGAAALAACVALRAALDRTFRPPWSIVYLPVALFLVVVVLQMTPLPQSLVGALSPATLSTRHQLLGESQQAAGPMTLSFYPLATAHGLRLALVWTAIFLVTVAVFRTAPQIKRLLTIVFAVGCLEATLALLQIFTRASGIYWSIDVGARNINSGSFINYSNFSQFMNLSIGAGLALLLVRLHEERRLGQGSWVVARPLATTGVQSQAGILGGLILCALSVFTSLSRNGAISLLTAAAIVATALYARGILGRRGWLLVLLPLGTLAALLLFAFDVVYERLATLHDSGAFADRWQLTLGALRAWRGFPTLGVGLGSHEFVFPMFDTAVTRSVAGHADNDYAQLLEETGVVGAAAVAVFMFIIGRQVVRLCRRGRTGISLAAFGLAFGLIAVAIHSTSDFGQHLPAIFCLTAISCGLVVQLSRLEHQAQATAFISLPRGPRLLMGRIAAVAAFVAITAVGAWTMRNGYDAFLAEEWWAMASQVDDRMARTEGEVADEDYQDLIAASEQALEHEPGNIVYAYWLNARRWQAVSREVGETSGQLAPSAEGKMYVQRIADELTKVRRICPTYGPPYALEGQLRLLILGEQRGSELIRQGVKLASYDPPTCFIGGEVAAREGRMEEAAELISRSVALEPSFYAEAIELFLFKMQRPDLARTLAGDDYQRLTSLANISAGSPQLADLTVKYRRDAEAALRRRLEDGKATAPDLAALASVEMQGRDFAAAVDLYRRALALDYKQVEWRLDLARALAELGQFEQAAHEAQICVRLRPAHAGAQQLIEELRKHLKQP